MCLCLHIGLMSSGPDVRPCLTCLQQGGKRPVINLKTGRNRKWVTLTGKKLRGLIIIIKIKVIKKKKVNNTVGVLPACEPT